jgi:hypothetical protein
MLGISTGVAGADGLVTGEFAAKRQEEVFERELMTMLTSVHVENSEQGLGSNRPVHVHFTAKNC